ncbi:MAG TPA: DUF2333 family protein [Gammaproteobacteria bacterium]|nr:DUF2333 family protein [Gammaproteobacteria bacterium]
MNLKDSGFRNRVPGWRNRRALARTGGAAGAVLLLLLLGLSWYWSREPAVFWVDWEKDGRPAVTGYATTHTLLRVSQTLLEKPGGYLSNDVMPPSLFLDNIPNWEFGVLVQVRDLSRVLRNDFSRSQTQSVEDRDLAEVEPNFNFDNNSWILPSSESRYRQAIRRLERYQARLVGEAEPDANFYARADNLREWLAVVEKRLGNLSQQLSASVGTVRVNTDLAGDPVADAAKPGLDRVEVKTPWLQIDDVFYEARGTAWALLHFLRAIEYDFRHVLADKNATVSLRQVIRELEASLAPMRSPMVLNGGGFGMFANHSLVMASYLSRANQAITNLRELLAGG